MGDDPPLKDLQRIARAQRTEKLLAQAGEWEGRDNNMAVLYRIAARETAQCPDFADKEKRDAPYKKLAAGTKSLEAKSPLVFFSLDISDVEDLETLRKGFDALPESERKRIAESPTYTELKSTLAFRNSSKDKPAADIVDDKFPEQLGI